MHFHSTLEVAGVASHIITPILQREKLRLEVKGLETQYYVTELEPGPSPLAPIFSSLYTTVQWLSNFLVSTFHHFLHS